MNHKLHRLILLGAILVSQLNATLAGNWERPVPDMVAPEPDSVVYIYNEAAGQFLLGANNWNTRASVADAGITFRLVYEPLQQEADHPGIMAWGMLNQRADKKDLYLCHLGSDQMYIDMGTQNQDNPDIHHWSLVRQDNGYYTIQVVEQCPRYEAGHYVAWNGGSNGIVVPGLDVAAAQLNGDTYGMYWGFVTPEAYEMFLPRKELFNKLNEAEQAGASTAAAEAVYANPDATVAEMREAIAALGEAIENSNQDNLGSIIAGASPVNPVDVTFIIKNADFSQNTSASSQPGWDCTFTGWQASRVDGPAGGVQIVGPFVEQWVPSGQTLGNYYCRQQITLPAGLYRVSAHITALQQGDRGVELTGCNFFAEVDGLERQALSCSSQGESGDVPVNYSIQFLVPQGGAAVTIGFETDATNANWVAFDNFRLETLGTGDSYVQLHEGYYRFVSAFPGYQEQQGTSKAMQVADNHIVTWASLDERQAAQVWHLTPGTATDRFYVQNYKTGEYVADYADRYRMAAGKERTVVFNCLAGGFFTMRIDNKSGDFDFMHTGGHMAGAGVSGNVVGWSNAGGADASAWYVVPVADSELERFKDIELEASLAALITVARDSCNMALGMLQPSEVDTQPGIVTDPSWLSSPYTEEMEGSLDQLIDGSCESGNFWHSQWSAGSVPMMTHYLQMDLKQGYNIVGLRYARRVGATNDYPRSFVLYGSSTPGEDRVLDGWTNLGRVQLPTPELEEAMQYVWGIDLQGCRYVRFYVDATGNGQNSQRGYWHAAELNLIDTGHDQIPQRVVTLWQAIQQAEELTTVTQADVDALQAALDAFMAATEPPLSDGDYYLRNVATGQFLCGANAWGTKASLSEGGQLMTLTKLDNGAYYIDSHISNGGASHYLGGGNNTFVDAAAAEHTITHVGSGIYTISNGGFNLAANADGLVNFDSSQNDAAAQWQFVTRSQLLASAQAATPQNPVNLTPLIADHSFGRNNQYISQWTGSPAKGGDNTNMCAEKFNTTFDVSQTLASMPAGRYRMRVQGFYRPGAAGSKGDTQNAIIYAATAEQPMRTLASQPDCVAGNSYDGVTLPNSMAHASACFTAGQYENTLEFTLPQAGDLTIGVRKTEQIASDWTIFDNFRLEYLGPDETPSFQFPDGETDVTTLTWHRFAQECVNNLGTLTAEPIWGTDDSAQPVSYTDITGYSHLKVYGPAGQTVRAFINRGETATFQYYITIGPDGTGTLPLQTVYNTGMCGIARLNGLKAQAPGLEAQIDHISVMGTLDPPATLQLASTVNTDGSQCTVTVGGTGEGHDIIYSLDAGDEWSLAEEGTVQLAYVPALADGDGLCRYTLRVCEVSVGDEGTVDNVFGVATIDITLLKPAPVLDGDYYIVNASNGQFLCGANAWGTKASLSEGGQLITLTRQTDGLYYIDTHISDGGTNHYLGINGFVDAAPAAIDIEPAAGGCFTLKADGSYLTLSEGLVDFAAGDPSDPAAQWRFVTRDEIIAAMAAATAESPVNVTSLIADHNFGRNNQNISQWTGSPAKGGDVTNMCAEKFNTTFDVSQTLTAMPAGNYRLMVQGYYRAGMPETLTPETDVQHATIYAAGAAMPLASILRDAAQVTSGDSYPAGLLPNSMVQASTAFTAGLYDHTLSFVLPEAGDLTIGVRKTEQIDADWTIFDNFRLFYCGPVTIDNLAALIATVEDFSQPCDAAIRASFDSALDNARKVLDQADASAVAAASEALQAAYDEACRSAGLYASVKDVIDHCDQIATQLTSAGQTYYNAQTKGVRQDYNAGTLDTATAPAIMRQALADAIAMGVAPGADLTGLLVNPDFDNNRRDGWVLDNCTWTNVAAECAEMYQKNFNVYQDVTGLPVGVYTVRLQGFVRQGNAAPAFANYLNGTEDIRAYIYGQSGEVVAKTPFKSVYQGKDTQPHYTTGDDSVVGRNDSEITDDNGELYYIPNGMAGFAAWEELGDDRFAIAATVYVTDGTLRIGAACDDYRDVGFWCIFDSFRLIYEGCPANPDPQVTPGNLLANSSFELWDDNSLQPGHWTTQHGTHAPMMLAASGQAAVLMPEGQWGEWVELAHEGFYIQPGVYELSFNVRSLDAGAQPVVHIGYHYGESLESISDYQFMAGLYPSPEGYEQLTAGPIVIEETTYISPYISRDEYCDVPMLIDDAALVRTADLPQIAPTDYAALSALYAANGGTGWATQWRLLKDGQPNYDCTQSSYPGVTIDDNGHVTGLDLAGFGLTGTLYSVGGLDINCPLAALQSLTTLDVSHGTLTGDVSALFEICPALVSINADDNCLSDNLMAAFGKGEEHAGQLSQRNQRPAGTVSVAITPDMGDMLMQMPTLCLNDDGSASVSVSDGNWCLYGTVAPGYTDYEYTISVIGSYAAWLEQPAPFLGTVLEGPSEGSVFNVTLTTIDHDANLSGEFNVGDLQAIIAHIFDEYAHLNRPLNLTAADMYPDHRINVQDVVACVNSLLLQPAAAAVRRVEGVAPISEGTLPSDEDVLPSDEDVLSQGADAEILIRGSQLVLNTTREVAAIDITVEGGTPQWQLPGFTVATAAGHSIIYSLAGATLGSGSHVVATVPEGMRVTRVTLSDCGGQIIGTRIDGTATGIQAARTAKAVSAYDLLGRPATQRSNVKIENGRTVINVQK